MTVNSPPYLKTCRESKRRKTRGMQGRRLKKGEDLKESIVKLNEEKAETQSEFRYS